MIGFSLHYEDFLFVQPTILLTKFLQKNSLNFGKDLFFWKSPELGLKNRLNLNEDQ